MLYIVQTFIIRAQTLHPLQTSLWRHRLSSIYPTQPIYLPTFSYLKFAPSVHSARQCLFNIFFCLWQSCQIVQLMHHAKLLCMNATIWCITGATMHPLTLPASVVKMPVIARDKDENCTKKIRFSDAFRPVENSSSIHIWRKVSCRKLYATDPLSTNAAFVSFPPFSNLLFLLSHFFAFVTCAIWCFPRGKRFPRPNDKGCKERRREKKGRITLCCYMLHACTTWYIINVIDFLQFASFGRSKMDFFVTCAVLGGVCV